VGHVKKDAGRKYETLWTQISELHRQHIKLEC
jgi:hypothetical protein